MNMCLDSGAPVNPFTVIFRSFFFFNSTLADTILPDVSNISLYALSSSVVCRRDGGIAVSDENRFFPFIIARKRKERRCYIKKMLWLQLACF